MPGFANLIRLFRRRLVLGLIFALSLTYCAVSLLRHEGRGISLENDFEDMDDNAFLNENDENSDEQISMKSLVWDEDGLNDENNLLLEPIALDQGNNTETLSANCRNSIQGKILIVDEKGYICYRKNVLANGCCNTDFPKNSRDIQFPASVKRYSCDTCTPLGCCVFYEYCVSCCLDPGKYPGKWKKISKGKQLRKEDRKTRKNDDILKGRLKGLDRFQYCLSVCRTSSASVQHENTYKNPHSKYCYNLNVPVAVALVHTPRFKDM